MENYLRHLRLVFIRAALSWLAVVFLFPCATAIAQDFSVRVSTDQAYVNQAILLIVQMGTDEYEAPELPEVDGCVIEPEGPPRLTKQISIFNGRRSESVTTELRYMITPKRDGAFVIPELTFVVNGKNRTTEAFEFTAKKSETGDLMEAEIHGLMDTVFVGQSLEVTLKIWIKAFRDPERRVTVSSNDMFRLMIKRTQWGIFESVLTSDSFQLRSEMVMKKDASGKPVEYYYYEIPATIYADRPGPIDTGKVNLICDYPLSLVASRDPFDLRGRRLSIGATRPIEATPKSNTLVAIDVPSEGRPKNYRGAVGEYTVTTAATPTEVSVGDPIKLQIAIEGTGRIDLLQAPPLSDIESLTDDFKVSSVPLPGFVRQPQKFFISSIRAKNEGVTEIPPIPFHFFNPKTESFETTYSDPIRIEVSPAESLSLNGFGKSNRDSRIMSSSAPSLSTDADERTSRSTLDFTNDFDSFLEAPMPLSNDSSLRQNSTLWWCSMLAPPTLWLACIVWLAIPKLRNRWSRLQPADVLCRRSISLATHSSEIRDAMRAYLADRLDQPLPTEPSAVGALRLAGLRDEAVETERILNQLANFTRDPSQPQDDAFHVDGAKQEALKWLTNIDKILSSDDAKHSALLLTSGHPKALKSNIIGLAIALSFLAGNFNTTSSLAAQQATTDLMRFNSTQQSEIFRDANEFYKAATKLRDNASTDSLEDGQSAVEQKEALEQFFAAAKQYQRLIDDGVRSETIFLNAANAYAQAGSPAQAVLNYRRVLWINPRNMQAKTNLKLLIKQLEETRSTTKGSMQSAMSLLNPTAMRWAAAVGSIIFWGFMVASLFARNRIALWGSALLPLAILLLALWSLNAYPAFEPQRPGILLAKSIELHESDGSNFPINATLNPAEGLLVDVLQMRGSWVELRMPNGQTGWSEKENVGIVMMEARESRR